MEKNKILLLIPVFNHGATLRQVVMDALEYHSDIMVVDDGSTDGSMETLVGLGVHCLSHVKNIGKGAAIRTGAKEALALGFTHIITMDADLQHRAFDIPLFKIKIECHPNAIIIGKRNFKTDNVPFSSVFGRSFSNFWLRLQTGCKVADVQSGFRAYPLFLFNFLTLGENRYSFEVEILVKSAWAGIAIKNVDISVLYQPKGERVSHFKFLLDNLYLTHLNTRLTLRSFLPLPHKQFNEALRLEKLSVLSPVRSLKRLADSNISPVRISISGGVGVFLGTLPLIACHTIAILFVTGFFRLNKLVALSTSQLCVIPFMPALCIETGYYMRHGIFLTDISMESLGYQCIDRLFEWFLGSLVVAPFAGFFLGGLIYAVLCTMKKNIRGLRTIEQKES